MQRVQLGGHVPLRVLLVDHSGSPGVWSGTTLPTAKIVNTSGTLIETVTLLPIDMERRDGDWGKIHRIGSLYSTGVYGVFYSWTHLTSPSPHVSGKASQFEVVAGGSTQGCVIGVEHFEQPGRDWLVMVSDDGTVRAGRDPR